MILSASFLLAFIGFIFAVGLGQAIQRLHPIDNKVSEVFERRMAVFLWLLSFVLLIAAILLASNS